MMYEMVIGKRPFGGETNEAIWHGHVAVPPPVPHEVDPGIPQPLSHIILHLLQKDPEQRYQSAEKLLEHLKTLGGSEAPPSLRPQLSQDIEELRSAATPAPTPGFRPAREPTRPASGSTPRRDRNASRAGGPGVRADSRAGGAAAT